MTDETQNCIGDQIARMKMMNSTVQIPPSGYLASPIPSADIFNISEMRTRSYLPPQPADHKHPFLQLVDKVVNWHYDRNLIDGSTDKDQTLKLAQELGELSDSVCKGKDIRDDIGDMLVVMLNITERNGISLDDCLERAWNDIKDRKGKMIDGIFVKEQDL